MEKTFRQKTTAFAARTIYCLAASLLLLPTVAWAGQNVRVQLVSGRMLEADVAPRTDEQNLWLVYRSQSATLHRPIAWNRIAAAEINGESMTGSQLKEALLAAPIAALTSLQNEASAGNEQNDAQESPNAEELPSPAARAGRTQADEALNMLFVKPRVVSVDFDVYLGNWDSDVEADGLIVHVRPIDATGHVAPVRGIVYADLHAARQIAFSDGPQLRGRRIDKIGAWTKQLHPAQVQADGAWFKLPFQADSPEFDMRLGYQGLVHVKLVVPGEGVFESSIDGVRIRPFAPLRDEMQRVEGRRFLPQERTGRGKRIQD